MRGQQLGQSKLVPVLWGTLGVASRTMAGNSVDTRGFRGVMATLVCGAAAGSASIATGYISVTVQEAETLGALGASWVDITDGVLNGSFKFTISAMSATGPDMYVAKLYERLDRPGAKRYIRPLATYVGTTGLGIRMNGAFLLCDPVDSLYAVQPTSVSTNHGEVFYVAGQ